MKKRLMAVVLLAVLLFCAPAGGEEPADTLTYAVYPYLPDAAYYRELIEARWAELEPGIRLVRAEWNCYHDAAPEGIDVVMYDASERDRLIADGWIRPISPEAVWEPEDIYPFALEGVTAEGGLYGIPVFLCGNFLIYDREWEALAAAEHLTDLADEIEILVVNSDARSNRRQYIIETVADARGEANPSAVRGEEGVLVLLDRLAIDSHQHDDDFQVAGAYDAGEGRGYIGFSESMRLLRNRMDRTWIKAVSFSDRENIPRLYTDAAAVTAGVSGPRYEKCLELMNVMAEAGVLTALSVQDGSPQYLLLTRKSAYPPLAERFPIYARLEELAGNEKNHVILTPGSIVDLEQ